MDVPRPHALGRSLAIASLLLLVAFAGLVSVAPPVAAATFYVAGPISGNTLWSAGNTYVMYRNVTVVPGVTLTIQGGATVRADPFVRLYVRGTLTAAGTPFQPVSFINNGSAVSVPWRGIQFNASSAGSVSRSSFTRVEQAVHAISSSPSISDNTIDQAFVGVRLEGSSSVVSGNRINFTNTGIQVGPGGDPILSSNTITNLTGNPALGIYAASANSLGVFSNWIQAVVASDGRTPGVPGGRGTDGGFAVGILVNGTTSLTAFANTITQVVGGRGGTGAASATGAGGNGGDGGSVAGIITFGTPAVDIEFNRINNLVAGHGGSGGGSSGAGTPGGNGGNGGTAAGMEAFTSATSARWFGNWITNVTAGSAGDGATSANTGSVGNGGFGGDGYGLLAGAAMNGNVSSNAVQTVRAGHGGNSSNGARGSAGGRGGQAAGFWTLGVDGSGSILSNFVVSLTGGNGGAGRSPAGAGGNATGLLAVGNGNPFNSTMIQGNVVAGLAGGIGGTGTFAGAGGGVVTGVGAIHVQLDSSSNTIDTLTGGKGGDAFILANPAGRGGDSTGMVAGLLPSARSSADTIRTITKGAPGSGSGSPISFGVGLYAVGNTTVRTRITITNGTLTAIGDIEIHADNYAQATTVNTPFSPAKIAVATASNLTVRNFLAVAVTWPNNITPVNGASILVADDGITVWNVSPPTGLAQWLLVTDRVYIGSATFVYNNTTSISVSYGSYGFWNNPRFVDMASSHTESFGMIDKTAPTSSASPLPPYENSLTFAIDYTSVDGNGTGVRNVTLWYRYDTGSWTKGPTQNVPGVPSFSFTATADGAYQFYTIATDLAGNAELPPPGSPAANDTWTIVDTLRPGSHVNPLPPYETTLSFLVSWAPDSGVTDIFSYTIQYNSGAGWRDWLVGTHGTSGTFTAASQGVHAFRSIAVDNAGNAEVGPAGNDTWTIVDTFPPASRVLPLPTYETSLTFLVTWGPQFDTFDIASFRIEVKDNNGAWANWIPSTGASFASFTGVDGHTYQFRSFATDVAGNQETGAPPTNDTWTNVDVTPPDSAVTQLPGYVNTLQFSIAWGPVAGTTDVASYTVQFKDGTGPWTDVSGYTGTILTSGTFSAGQDGHAYAFRTIARDRAGNTEVAPAGNDTWTIVDTRPPSVTDTRPIGANTNVTPWIVVTFSEPMDRTSVQQAFTITPAIDGAYQWSADSTTVTFVPRPLLGGTQYTVIVGSNAQDAAGNRMVQQRAFQFVTGSTFSFGDFWWIFLLVGGGVAGGLFMIMRRRAGRPASPAVAPQKQTDAIVEDVFLLNHRDGVLIKHETRRLRPDVDTDILSGMLTAVQQFVKDALRGDDYAELNEMTVGHMHILIGRGKWLVLAARIEGAGSEMWTAQIERCIKDMEDHHWDQLEDWNGDMALSRVLTPYIKKLIQGGYV